MKLLFEEMCAEAGLMFGFWPVLSAQAETAITGSQL
jgi:hypothetical protein